MATYNVPLTQRHGGPPNVFIPDPGMRSYDVGGHGGHDHSHSYDGAHGGHDHDHGNGASYYAAERPPSPSKPQITYASLGLSGLPLPSSAARGRGNPRLFFRRSIFKPLAEAIRTITSDKTTRKIFIFLIMNLSFCGVEALYGLITNSLGLFTDAIHMGFDSTAIAMGLAASVIGKWAKDERWSYGWGRVEVLAGFVNAVALFFAAFGIIWEACERLITPETIHTDKLLLVAVLGLGVNLVGIFAFDHGALHGHAGHDHSHGHSHSSHDEHDHDHGHGGGGKENSTWNPLLHGMFLHILADTLGSVGVITSAILVDWFGWTWSDPLCSLFIAILILMSVWPLLKSSALTLLQRTPPSLDRVVGQAQRKILGIPGVVSADQLHVWELKTGYVVGTVCVVISEGDTVAVTKEVGSILRGTLGCREVVVQVERGAMVVNGYNY